MAVKHHALPSIFFKKALPALYTSNTYHIYVTYRPIAPIQNLHLQVFHFGYIFAHGNKI